MIHSISDVLLSQLSEFVADKMGLHFPGERFWDLERGLLSAAQELGFNDVASCIQWFLSSSLTKTQIEILASHLTVGETYFFREKKSFEVLEEHILPELICSRRSSKQPLRIWSAGCSTGEESYSIAILLNKIIPDLKDWDITILATDINPNFLKKAIEGMYSEWSFRDTPPWVKERYFKKTNYGYLKILPNIKKMVNFSYLNLAEDTYPSLLNNTNAMDIIFCRNVLMYFSPERTKKVIQKIYRCLVDDGWLIVGPVETSHIFFSQFKTVNFPDMILYKKVGSGVKDQRKGNRVQESWTRDWGSVEIQPPVPDICHLSSDSSPSSIDLHEKALSFYEQGHYAEALERIMEVLSQNPNEVKTMALLARTYANQGKLAEALDLCEKAIFADKLNPGLYYLFATILQEEGQIEEAIKSLKQSIYLDQNFVLAYFVLGNIALQQRKPKESEKYFRNALSILSTYQIEDILPESEGMTAGRLMEIITGIRGQTIEDREQRTDNR